ncbi:TonB-dependent receptor [Ideonella azotifigens]|uniref:TonB-dependent receptor-like beta-barrel domain-containing protein n=1 Tax=Ideonella azotifigens TaxID=513160 RepID=A0ABN1KLD2_9BURK|nr:TonB-dependent receptor [Ideonella azotifigens]MCD2344814.1 TonB-dependent receptor [Ideonella azotifigens]
MFTPSRTGLALALALAYPLLALPVRAQTVAATDGGSTTAAPAPQRVEISSQRQRLDAARNGLSPDTGSSIYRFDQQDIAKLPMGADTPLNQVILQAPGVVQDSYGQLHVRGDHADLQYRIDGIVIPEAIGGFGQALETRFADQIQVLTGALPAQYGYRTAGVVDIHSKGANQQNGGQISLLGGSNGHREGSLELGGSVGALSYYMVGSAMHDDQGIENPTSSRHALHDETQQGNGFGYFSYVLTPETRVNLILGAANNRFQIPNVAGQTPDYSLAGHDNIDSATLDARQKERNHFGVLSLQSSLGQDVDYQVALFSRYTDVHYRPDEVGDLAFNGVAADVARSNRAAGLQADASWHLNATHTLRGGVFYQSEKGATRNDSLVFPADGDGNQTSDQPLSISDDAQLKGHTWGAYLQDQWQPVKALTVNYGLRFDQVRTVVDEQQLSPRVGLVYDIDAMTRVHAGYSRYFTPPPTEQIDQTSIQKFQGTTNALPSDANTAVRSERSNYYDIGLERQIDSHLTVGVDGYYRQVRHLQDEGQFGNALIYSAFNYSHARVYGLELSASYRDEAFSAYANVAFARALGKGLETGQFNFEQDEIDYINSNWVHLDHDQATTASAGASYQWANGLSTSADLLFGSGLRNGFANSSHLPSYTQVNLSAHRSFDLGTAVGPVDLRLSALNVFDRIYQIRDGSGIGVGAPQYAQRRTVLAGISKSF